MKTIKLEYDVDEGTLIFGTRVEVSTSPQAAQEIARYLSERGSEVELYDHDACTYSRWIDGKLRTESTQLGPADQGE